MNFDKKRERRRRELAWHEIEQMLRRYPGECGVCFVRRATAEELERACRIGKKDSYEK